MSFIKSIAPLAHYDHGKDWTALAGTDQGLAVLFAHFERKQLTSLLGTSCPLFSFPTNNTMGSRLGKGAQSVYVCVSECVFALIAPTLCDQLIFSQLDCLQSENRGPVSLDGRQQTH